MDAGERALFTKGVHDATARITGAELDAALSVLGWADALVLDEQAAVADLFEAQGRAGVTSGALDVVLARALGASAGPVVLPSLGRTTPPGELRDGAVTVRGLGLATAAGEGPLHVVCRDDDGRVALATVDGLERRPIHGLDPALGLVEVTGSVAGEARPTPSAALEGGWHDGVAAGQRAVAHELVGAAAAMLDLAREHAVERIQFGVPIASFQAVRHRLADSLVAVESARGALDAAWEAGSPFDAAVAKAIAGRSARLVAKHAQQVLAGIGFTLEHPLHRHVRRVRVLDGLLGDARSLTRELGEQLLRDRGLPAILPL
jgi:hypothetical protein